MHIRHYKIRILVKTRIYIDHHFFLECQNTPRVGECRISDDSRESSSLMPGWEQNVRETAQGVNVWKCSVGK